MKNNAVTKFGYTYIILLMIAAFCNTPVLAQANGVLADLEQTLGAAKTDKERAEAGLAIAEYYYQKKDANCLSYAENAIKPASKAKLQTVEADLHTIIGNWYFEQKNYKKAVSSLESEYAIRKKLLQAQPRSYTCYNLGMCYIKLGNNRKAKKYFDESWQLAKKLGNKELLNSLTKVMCELAVADKNYKVAYEYLNQYLEAENKKFKEENARLMFENEEQGVLIEQQDSTINEQKLQYQLLEQEKQLLAKDKELAKARSSISSLQGYLSARDAEIANKQRNYMIWIVVSVILLLAVSIWGFLTKRRDNKRLAEKNDLIQSKNEEISRKNEEITIKKEEIAHNLMVIAEKNKDITDSLLYAGKIQQALLGTFEQLKYLMGGFFVFYQPKDIVSGDFYWCYKVDNKFVFTVGDCTGHSVPGAFMSMLGLSLLNQIVAQQREVRPSRILELMRQMVKNYLGQTGLKDEPKDGMDMAICVWDLDTNKASFAGAYNPMIHISDGELKVYSAVKSPVGIHTRELDFEDVDFEVKKGDRLYMFSDGYPDQFGYERQEKFKMARFRNLLLETSNLPIQRQGDKIKTTYFDWKGKFVQIDDVCVLGVEI